MTRQQAAISNGEGKVERCLQDGWSSEAAKAIGDGQESGDGFR